MRRDLAEEAQGIRLVAPFLVLTGERQRPLGEGVRLLQAAGQQLRLPQGETTERLKADRSIAVVCSIACVSSGTASATRPAQAYRPHPRPQPSRGNRPGGPRPDRCPRPVRAGEAPWAGHPGGGPADRSPTRQTSGSRGAQPPRQSGALRPQGPCPRRTCPARHGTRRGRHGRTRRAGKWPKRSWRRAPSKDATVCLKQSIARR